MWDNLNVEKFKTILWFMKKILHEMRLKKRKKCCIWNETWWIVWEIYKESFWRLELEKRTAISSCTVEVSRNYKKILILVHEIQSEENR